MPPPFSDDRDIEHVRKAFDLLKPGGRLVAIVSGMAGRRSRASNVSFMAWVEGLGGSIEPLPENSFKSAFRPTGVSTQMVVLDKPTTEGKATVSNRGTFDPNDPNILHSINGLSVSRSAILPHGATPKGLAIKEAELYVQTFLRRFKGANDIVLRVHRSQAGAFGPESRDKYGTINAGFDPDTNTLHLVSGNLQSLRDLRDTLQHELLVHKGLGIFSEQDEARIISA